jgi:DNA helicase-2/ATP-dependent DNA helicase PcrA
MGRLEHTLSDEQTAAVWSDDRAIVVVAGAGSGKTEVAARRVERLLAESPDESFRVLALSYTLKAADELRSRFKGHLGERQKRVDTNTLHGFAHSLLRQHGTRIGLPVEPEVLIRDEDRAELLARWLSTERRSIPEDILAVLHQLDIARARLMPGYLLEEWESALSSVGAMDYGTMLTRATELLGLQSAHRQLTRLYTHVIVDEAQNLTPAQYELLTALIGPPRSSHIPTMVVGDDKQSIVSFAGADPTLITRFSFEYQARRFELRRNFRSAGAIVAAGDAVATRLGQTASHIGRTTAYAAAGLVNVHEAIDEKGEATFVADWVAHLLANGLPSAALAPGESSHVHPDDIAVLARTAAALRPTQEVLETAGHKPAMSSSPEDWLATLAGKVTYEIIALRSARSHRSTHWQLARLLGVDETDVTSPTQVAACLATNRDPGLRSLSPLCSSDTLAEFMTGVAFLEPPASPDGQMLASWDADFRQLLETWHSFAQQTDRVEQTWGNFRIYVSRQQRGDDLDSGVRLLTIHKAQGREYRAVAVVALNDGQLPDFRAVSADNQLSELRTFYVAITRASRVLVLSRARSRVTRYGPRGTAPSPYLAFIRGAH